MNENSKKILIANIAIVAIIAVAVVGVTYAWFSTTAEDTGSVTVTSGTLSIRYDQGLKIEASNLKPATDTQVLDAYICGKL